MKNQSVIPLPIHFKTPGRSYSQIGRKGNVALYSVYSDYFSFPDFALPYVLIGFELIVIKTKNGIERYPSAWQFGKSAWSIPKSFSSICRIGSRCCEFRPPQLRSATPTTLPDRSASSAGRSIVAASPSKEDKAQQIKDLELASG